MMTIKKSLKMSHKEILGQYVKTYVFLYVVSDLNIRVVITKRL